MRSLSNHALKISKPNFWGWPAAHCLGYVLWFSSNFFADQPRWCWNQRVESVAFFKSHPHHPLDVVLVCHSIPGAESTVSMGFRKGHQFIIQVASSESSSGSFLINNLKSAMYHVLRSNVGISELKRKGWVKLHVNFTSKQTSFRCKLALAVSFGGEGISPVDPKNPRSFIKDKSNLNVPQNWWSMTHRIHGTELIFTYMNGWFLWFSCR